MNTISFINRNTVLRLLQIKPSEAQQVGLSFLYAFFIGMIQCFVIAIPLSLFLARYSTSYLPYIYIITTLVSLPLASTFDFFEHRLALITLLKGTLLACGISLLIFWLLLYALTYHWILLGLIVWGWVVFNFSNVILNCLLNQLFTLQQGKRLYGLMSAAQALGGIVAGFSIPLLTHLIGTSQIIILTAGIMLVIYSILHIINQFYSPRLNKGFELTDQSNSREHISLRKVFKQAYVPLVFLLVCLGIFEFYTLDMLFNTMAQKRYTQEDQLASFFGIFFASTDILNLIVGIALLSWMFKHFGVIITYLLNPIIIGILVLGISMVHLIPNTFLLLFWMVTLARFIDETFITTINEQALLLLFQPLKSSVRIWAIAKKETGIVPLATGVIGLILLVIDYAFGITLMHFFILLLFFYSAILVVLLILRPYYMKELLVALSKHLFIKPFLYSLDKDSLEILTEHLKSPYSHEVLYALNTIEKINEKEFSKHILHALTHPEPEVRMYALSKIEELQIYSALKSVNDLRCNEKDPELLEKILITYAAIGEKEAQNKLLEDITNSHFSIRKGAMIGLLKFGSKDIQDKIFQNVRVLALSNNDEERLLAAGVLQNIILPQKTEILLKLMRDKNIQIRNISCKAAENIQDSSLFPSLIDNLATPNVMSAAFLSLLTQGEEIFSYIQMHFDKYSIPIQRELLKLLGHFSSDISTKLLLQYTKLSSMILYHTSLHALRQKHFQASKSEIDYFKKLVSNEVKNILFLQQLITDMIQNSAALLLKDLLHREMHLAQERVFLLLSFFYPEDSILTAERGFMTQDEDLVSYSIEVLTETLTSHDQKLILPVFLFDIKDIAPKKIGSDPLLSSLEKLFHPDIDFYVCGIKSAIIYTTALVKHPPFRDSMKALASSNPHDKILQETYAWTMAEWPRE